MIRAIARESHREPLAVFRSSLRDGLVDYVDILQRTALEAYRHAELVSAAAGLTQGPKVPAILAENNESNESNS